MIPHFINSQFITAMDLRISIHIFPLNPLGKFHLCLDLALQSILQSHGISSKLADTLAKLVNGHWVLVEVESEIGLVVDESLLRDVELGGILGDELLWDWVGGVLELLEEIWLGVCVSMCNSSST